MSQLGLFFLGPPEIRLDDRPVAFPTRKSIALLAYLSVTGKPQRRDTLAAFFWPEQDQSRARASLRHALWTLGKAGLADWVASDGELIGLQPGYELDAGEFQSLLAQARLHTHPEGEICPVCLSRLSQAAGLYRADFLAGFTLRDSPEFDDWQMFQAESLRQELADLLERLVRLHAAAGEFELAIQHARRWAGLDAFHEPPQRWLMRLYASSRRRSLALKQYETLRQTLQRELGVEPEETTRRLYEEIRTGLTAATAVRATPPANPPPGVPLHHNLPPVLTSLLGRVQETAAVCGLLRQADTRLLTLTGPPGIGKTRLSLQAAAELLDHFKEGVYFVPLTAIQEIELVPRAITQSLGIIETGSRSPEAALKEFFRDRPMLLVLDNFEHVLGAAPLVIELLGACPGLKILATSRAPLRIRSERQFPLEPLELPDLERLPDFETLSACPSIALFAARAAEVEPGFRLDEANAAAVAEICYHLDGLPLAIELAAAWTKLLPLKTLLERLSNRLGLLKGGPVDLPERQRTLRAAIDWSYQLLERQEQKLLARLSIFVESWSLEGALAVMKGLETAGGNGSPEDVLEGLYSLVDKSLVERRAGADESVRFSMLETIHEYAAEKLLASRGEHPLHRRHAIYYVQLASKADMKLVGAEQQVWLGKLRDEHKNLGVALQWLLDNDEALPALQMAACLWRYWWMHGHLSEGRDWLDRALAMSGSAGPEWRARALRGAGVIARSQGDYRRAAVFLEECLELERRQGNLEGTASVLNSLGVLHHYQGQHDPAYRFHAESLALRRKLGDRRDIAVSLNNLAMVAQEQGSFEQAETLYQESLELLGAVDDARGVAAVLANLGALLNDQGQAAEAEAYFKESLLILKDLGQRDDIIECLEGFAEAAALLGNPKRGASLLGAAQVLREMIGAPLPPYKRHRYGRLMQRLAAQLAAEELQAGLACGRAMPLSEAIDYALGE